MKSSKEPIKEVVKQFTQDYVSAVVKESTKNIIKKYKVKKRNLLEDELKNLTYEEIEDYFEANPEYQKAFTDTIKSINKKASSAKMQKSFKTHFTNYLPSSIPIMSVFIALTILAIILLGPPNERPDIPSVPKGPLSGSIGVSHSYSTSAFDADGDNIRYLFDWDDGDTTYTEYYPAGTTVNVSHAWSEFKVYRVRVKAIDKPDTKFKWLKIKLSESKWSESIYVSIIDSTPPPAPSPDDNIDGWSNVNNPTFSWLQVYDISGIENYTYWIDSGPLENTSSNSVTLPEQSDGNHTFHVRAVDNAGNIGEYGSHEFSIDTIAPVPDPDDKIPDWSNVNDPTFSWPQVDDINGIAHYNYKIDNGPLENTFSNSVTLPEQSDGNHTFHVRAVDNIGNIGEYGSHEFNIDTIAPSAPNPYDGITGWSNVNTPRFRWSPPEDMSGIDIYYYNIDSNLDRITTSASVDLPEQPDGNHIFNVKAKDNAGNIGEYGSHEFSIDTIAPSVPLPKLSGDKWSFSFTTFKADSLVVMYTYYAPSFNWFPSEDVSGIASYYYKVDKGSEDWTSETSVTLPLQSAGRHTFHVRAKDNAGNFGQYGSINFVQRLRLPDLILYYTEGLLFKFDELDRLVITVKNQGNADAPASTTFIDFEAYATSLKLSTPPLKVGESTNLDPVTLPKEYCDSNDNFKIVIDYSNNVDESDEENTFVGSCFIIG